jgi:hypothetical protein
MGKGIYAALGAIALGMAGPAVAQGIPVYDSSGYLQALATVKNTLSMIDQGRSRSQKRSSSMAASTRSPTSTASHHLFPPMPCATFCRGRPVTSAG